MPAPEVFCPPLDGSVACAALPPAFVRLRYFFGKRLGVADFVDEQRYHNSKRRFHNQHLHGSGIVCGLGLSIFEEEGAPTTVLRVGKGAALDACGREIIVGVDQCIDIDAWFRRQLEARREADSGTTWPADELDVDGRLPLCVALRYVDCPTDPEPAPRDPCGCSEGGAEFGRVREGFELALMNEAEAEPYKGQFVFPSVETLTGILESETPEELEEALGGLISAGCPQPPDEPWLILGCFRAVLASDGETVEAIEGLEATPLVVSSGALQALTLAVTEGVRGALPGGFGGPRVAGVDFVFDDSGTGKHAIELRLSGPVVAATVAKQGQLRVQRLDTDKGWVEPPNTVKVAVEYADNGGGPLLRVSITDKAGKFLKGGGRYAATVVPGIDQPIVDAALRPLGPPGIAARWVLTDVDGALTATPLRGGQS